MVKATVKTYRTLDGKYVGQVRRFEMDRTVTHYETPEYVTRQMAVADANCWMEFHMSYTDPDANHNTEEVNEEVETEYTVNENDTVYYRAGKMTGAEFSTWLNTVISRNADKEIKYDVEPFNNGSNGFHLRVKIGNQPVRRYRVFKHS